MHLWPRQIYFKRNLSVPVCQWNEWCTWVPQWLDQHSHTHHSHTSKHYLAILLSFNFDPVIIYLDLWPLTYQLEGVQQHYRHHISNKVDLLVQIINQCHHFSMLHKNIVLVIWNCLTEQQVFYQCQYFPIKDSYGSKIRVNAISCPNVWHFLCAFVNTLDLNINP